MILRPAFPVLVVLTLSSAASLAAAQEIEQLPSLGLAQTKPTDETPSGVSDESGEVESSSEEAIGGEEVDAATTQGLPADIEELSLEELLAEPVVTASGGAAEERVLAFANVVRVTAEEIARHGWRSIAEVLANTPGLYVIDDYVIPSIGVRGVTGGLRAGSRLVKVMVNGVTVHFRPDLTAFLGPEFIPMEAVDRIEIVQGPLSALYGANAFIATVNVITWQPTEGESISILATRAHGMVGGDPERFGNLGGGLSIFLAHGDQDLGLVAAVSVDSFNRSGLEVEQTFPAQDAALERYRVPLTGRSKEDVARPQSVFAQLYLGRVEEVGRLTLQGGVQKLDSMAEFQVNSIMSHRSRVAIDNYWSNLRFERAWSEALSTTAEVGLATGAPTRETRLYLPETYDAYYEPRFNYQALTAGVQLFYAALGDQLRLRLSVDGEIDRERILFYRETFLRSFGERKAGETLDLIGGEHKRRRTIRDIGVGFQITGVPQPDALPGLRLTGNVRADFIRYGNVSFPAQLSWRGGVVYRWSKDLTTKLIGGRAFQTPSPVLMFTKGGFGTANNVVGSRDATVIGSAPVRPQTVTGAEAIVSAHIFDLLTLDAGPFYQQVADRILFKQLATDFVAENGETSRSVGFLASLRFDLGPYAGAYATATAQGQIVNGKLIGQPPPLFPSYFGTVGLDVDPPRTHLRINAHLRWASERGASESNQLLNNSEPYTLPGYADLDFTVMIRELHLWDEMSETRVSASLRNSLDARHSEPGFTGFDIPNQGRTLWIELRQEF